MADRHGAVMGGRFGQLDRFFRSSATLARDAPGPGLGLATVRAVVAAHGGSVGVSSGPFGGARFEVRLPHAATT